MSSQSLSVSKLILQQIDRWANKKLQPENDTITINRKRLYILPTRSGLMFIVLFLAILAAAINYENSLSYLLTSLLVSIGILCMIYTHQNLNNLQFFAQPPNPCFCGNNADFPLRVSSSDKRLHLNIHIVDKEGNLTFAHLPAESESITIRFSIPTKQRGKLSLGKLKIHTEFPLGLFHAWTWIHLNINCIVYPKPMPQLHNFHRSGEKKTGSNLTLKPGVDEFAGVREYQKGDSPKLFAWKSIAKTNQLQTKQFFAEAGNDLHLDWNQFPKHIPVETRLSILCEWIIQLSKQDVRYGITIPNTHITPNHGKAHYHACLTALAMFQKPTTI